MSVARRRPSPTPRHHQVGWHRGRPGGTGLLTIDTVTGNGPTGGSLYCSNLVGTYIRVTAVVTALLNGVCVVNNFSARVTFVFVGEFEPVGSGAGTSQPIYTANFWPVEDAPRPQ